MSGEHGGGSFLGYTVGALLIMLTLGMLVGCAGTVVLLLLSM